MDELEKLRRLWDRDTGIPPERRHAIEARLAEVLHEWEGTPWMPASCVKRRGADCIGFVQGVLEELYRRKFDLGRKSPVGLSHESDAFLAFAVRALGVLPIEKSETIGCGDLILERPENGHAHIYIVGYKKGMLFHCLHGVGVCFTGTANLANNLTLYRLKDKEQWI